MRKFLFYGMTGDNMCFLHILMNALDLAEEGMEARVIFEGASVKLVAVFEAEKNPLYLKVKEQGLIAGICLACSKAMGVYEQCLEAGLPFLSDMMGHAGMKHFILDGYQVVSI